MKYKKFLSSKSRFWVGIGACAVVGLIATVVSYFSSTQHIDNMYKSIFYRVSAYDVFDKTEVSSLNMDKATTVNTDIVVNDDSTTPVLVRIRYATGYKNPGTKTTVYENVDIEKYDSNFSASVKNSNSFLYNKHDGAYYYTGILDTADNGDGSIIQHLDSLTFKQKFGNYEVDKTLYEMNSGELTYLQSDKSTWGNTDAKLGKNVSIVGDNYQIGLKIIVEAVGAIDKDGNSLTLTGEETADEMESYWNNLGLRSSNYKE